MFLFSMYGLWICGFAAGPLSTLMFLLFFSVNFLALYYLRSTSPLVGLILCTCKFCQLFVSLLFVDYDVWLLRFRNFRSISLVFWMSNSSSSVRYLELFYYLMDDGLNLCFACQYMKFKRFISFYAKMFFIERSWPLA